METYTFNIGSYECTIISDGTHPGTPSPFPSPASFLFPGVPEQALEQAFRLQNRELHDFTEWIIPFTSLLVNTGEKLVLVDTGAGALGPDTGKLLPNLASLGLKPKDINIIILTHAHRDHVGGNTDTSGRLVFPDARFFMWQGEWDYWTAEETRQKYEGTGREAAVEYATRNLPPIQEQLELIRGKKEILPGITAIPAPGHTPGHMALRVSSNREQLLCLADTVHHLLHLEHPEWATGIDYDTELVNTTRRRLLDDAARQRCLVLCPHLDFPGLGYVIPSGNGWRWQPL